MQTKQILFWIFWGTIYTIFAIWFWKYVPITQSVKEDMAKFSFGITLLCMIFGAILANESDGPKFHYSVFFLLIAIALPFWPIPLGVTWMLMVSLNKASSLVINYETV